MLHNELVYLSLQLKHLQVDSKLVWQTFEKSNDGKWARWPSVRRYLCPGSTSRASLAAVSVFQCAHAGTCTRYISIHTHIITISIGKVEYRKWTRETGWWNQPRICVLNSRDHSTLVPFGRASCAAFYYNCIFQRQRLILNNFADWCSPENYRSYYVLPRTFWYSDTWFSISSLLLVSTVLSEMKWLHFEAWHTCALHPTVLQDTAPLYPRTMALAEDCSAPL